MTTQHDTLMTTTFRDLPHDILIHIVDYLDVTAHLVQVALVSKCMSHICFQKLWHTPLCKSPHTLKLMLSTLELDHPMYPYKDWFMGLTISLDTVQPFSIAMTTTLSWPIKTLQLSNVNATMETGHQLVELFVTSQLRELILSDCSNEMLMCLVDSPLKNIIRICIKDCHVSDRWVRQITRLAPQLRYFSSERSAYIMSDAAILAIAQHCPLIETLIVTLPNHIIQSNTITMLSLQSLSTHAHHLKRFICRGQVRIATRECQLWFHAHCPSLEYCDLSF